MDTFQLIIIALLVANLIAALYLIFRKGKSGESGFQQEQSNKMEQLLFQQQSLEKGVKQDFKINREESARLSKENREELSHSLRLFNDRTEKQLKEINEEMQKKLLELFTQAAKENKQMREMLDKSLKNFQDAFDKNVKAFNELQREKFNDLSLNTEKKLEQMRLTVDEKLQKTLESRLTKSFELVQKQLENVQTGLGEMQTLAKDVGGLKKVLSNVKMRGTIGEVQLSMLLENLLAPDQYEANVKTKASSNDLVEFAIKLPGKDLPDDKVYLPVDAKFPKEVYEHLLNAYEIGDQDKVAQAQNTLNNTIKKMAKDIRDKYIDPPNTTDFAILFLPFESIYAEVVRNSTLLEQLQREFKVVVTGPTTLAAILNSLQMGFRSLAIQKRSSEVWEVLGAVKTEFGKFGEILEKAQKKIQQANNDLDNVIGTRTRAINRRLRDVEALPSDKSDQLLGDE